MAEFKLSATITISIYTTVEAETLEEAIKEAEGRHIEYAHNFDTETQALDAWIVEEFDGEPVNIKQS